MPFVGVWHAQFLGHAGVEAEHRPSQLFVVYCTEHFVVRAVDALVEGIFAECKVLV